MTEIPQKNNAIMPTLLLLLLVNYLPTKPFIVLECYKSKKFLVCLVTTVATSNQKGSFIKIYLKPLRISFLRNCKLSPKFVCSYCSVLPLSLYMPTLIRVSNPTFTCKMIFTFSLLKIVISKG